MANRLRTNIGEFIRELDKLAPGLTEKALPIAERRADDAATEIRDRYPVITGNLVAGVRTVTAPRGGTFRARVVVQSQAPHAHLYEFGTHVAGPHAVFVPITQRERRAFKDDVIALVEAEGFRVTGDG